MSVNPTSAIGTNPQFAIGSSTQTSFVITNNGNIYIGTTTPAFASRVFISNNTTLTDAGLVIQDNRSAGGGASLTLSQDWDNSVGTQIYYSGSGSDGTKPTSLPRSVIWQGDTGGIVLQVSAGPILFATGGTALNNERMRINAVGNIGIGTTTPYSRFHVSQGAFATTTVNFGEVGTATSKACFTKNVSGADISFYFSAANALVVESNLCR